MAHTACLVCFISTVNGHSNKKRRKEEGYPWKAGARSRHTANLKQSILRLLISMAILSLSNSDYVQLVLRLIGGCISIKLSSTWYLMLLCTNKARTYRSFRGLCGPSVLILE